MSGAYYDGEYRNIFSELGISDAQTEARLCSIFQTMFYGTEEERIYHPVGDDMGYIEDTGNSDVRTEGMSYGMMMCVQLDRKEEFDRIWKWAKTYMYLEEGENAGYFAWSCATDGTKNAFGPAPDGEEFFAMSLFFAAHRWGRGKGIFDYQMQAQNILHECLHKGENGTEGRPMWEPSNHLIKFITECDWSDPSYHLPHFYELFSEWAYVEDRDFWKEAAAASRRYLEAACDPFTGLSAEYAEYDGTPCTRHADVFGRHDWFYSDAYRTAANIGLDHEWFGNDDWEKTEAKNILGFFEQNPMGIYQTDGTRLDGFALHPVGLFAALAQASLAADSASTLKYAGKLWNEPLRTGDRRYYDNCLYMFAFLAMSGRYRIWKQNGV